MRALALALLVAAGPPAAAQDVGGVMTTFTSFVSEHLSAARHALVESGILVGHNKTCSCENCTEHVAKYVTEFAMAKMAASCKAGQGCPHACRQLEESPKVMLGMMLVKLRPVELAEMYCAGKGACTKRQLIADPAGFHARAMKLTLQADKEDVDEVLEKMQEMEGKVAPDAPHERLPGAPGTIPRSDPECMHKVIGHVMDKMQPKCDGESTGMMAAACEFSEENPEVFHGMMVGKLEPWKYAAGYCAKHPHKGHHHGLWAALRWVKHAIAGFHHHDCDRRAMHECFHKCGEDKACVEKCPKPWQHLAKKCQAFHAAKECHMGCHHNIACHFKCPKGPMRMSMKKVAFVVKHIACHAGCKADEACHKDCPAPWKHFDEKCAHVDEIKKCHEACGYDRACHHQCPRVWQFEEPKPEVDEEPELPEQAEFKAEVTI